MLPGDKDTDVLALYVDPDPAVLDADKYAIGGNRGAKDLNAAQLRQSTSTGHTVHPDQITGRHTLRLEQGEELSFGTYFNAFPAGYWRRWTVVTDVRLTVALTGAGASVTVYRSMANGRSQRVDMAGTGADAKGEFTFDLSLKPFVDGGWYWYDVVAGEEPVEVEAVWDAEVPDDRLDPGSLDDRDHHHEPPGLLRQAPRPDGQRPRRAGPARRGARDGAGHPEGGRLPAVPGCPGGARRQAARDRAGQHRRLRRLRPRPVRTVRKGTATYVMMMDDDVVCEPESIIRAVTFADLAKRPTIVGGHMFSIYDRSVLHSFGEIVQRRKFWWRSPSTVMNDWDFSARNLRSARWLHRRIDVDYNGWFMCLVPMQTLREIGLSLPLFIKWDDSEFGLRAGEAGYPTVTFPGAAVWHIPWTDKNDALDWQAYFHHRNRLIAALLHSPYPRAGRWSRRASRTRSSTWSRCSTPPSSSGTRRSRTSSRVRSDSTRRCRRSCRRSTPSASSGPTRCSRRSARPSRPPGASKPPRRGKDDSEVPRKASLLVTAALAPIRQLQQGPARSPGSTRRRRSPRWTPSGTGWRSYDSAVVSMPDGMSAALYQRDPDTLP